MKAKILEECGTGWEELRKSLLLCHLGSTSTAQPFVMFSLSADKLESSNLISDAEIHSWRQSFERNLREGRNTLNLAEVQAIVQSFGETIDVAEREVSKCFELRENVDRVGRIDCIEFEVVMKMLKDLTLSRGFCSWGSSSAVEMGVGAAAAFASEAFASAAAFASSAAAFCATRFSNSLSARARVVSESRLAHRASAC